MASIKRGVNYLIYNRTQFCDSLVKNYLTFLPDKLYLSLRYRFLMGCWIDWKNPKKFSEKLQWLKIHNRKREYTTMVDKYAVKEYVAERIGKEYIIPTLDVWNKPEEIDWNKLPNQFVIKTTHGGGGSVIICKDKSCFNTKEATDKLKRLFKSNIYTSLREWPYKNVTKRIIAEKFIVPDEKSSDLLDYKFFCFNGKVRFFKVDFGRFINHHANYYSPSGILLDFGESGIDPDPNHKIKLPTNLELMIELSEKLSQGQPFLRVDMYNVNGNILFGELTFYPASGLLPWTPSSADDLIGSYLTL